MPVSALWDGTRRRIPVESGLRELTWSGTSDVFSLRVNVLSTSAKQFILVSYGGLEYPYRHDSTAGQIKSTVRTDLFQNESYMQHAIATALHPFVRSDDYPRRPRFYETVPE